MGPYDTFSRTLWGTGQYFGRHSQHPLLDGHPFHVSPPMNISPSLRSRMPAIIRISVVLPQPEGPRMVTYSPSFMRRLMLDEATTFPIACHPPKSTLASNPPLAHSPIHLQDRKHYCPASTPPNAYLIAYVIAVTVAAGILAEKRPSRLHPHRRDDSPSNNTFYRSCSLATLNLKPGMANLHCHHHLRPEDRWACLHPPPKMISTSDPFGPEVTTRPTKKLDCPTKLATKGEMGLLKIL